MLPLTDDDHPTLIPPTFQLSHFERPLSLVTLEALEAEVHFVSGNAHPMVRCNAEDPEGCILCSADFPILNRRLTLAYDYREDRLWAAALPNWVWAELQAEAECRPEHEWNFLIHWTGRGYCVQHSPSNFVREYSLTRDEREAVQRKLRTGILDLASAIPRLCNAEMLRLPALLEAAMYFGVDGEPNSDPDNVDLSTIHS